MYIQIYFKRFALLIGMVAIATICFSQHKTILGLNLTGENTSSSDVVVGIGGTFERQFNKHHGFETGLYYRTFEVHYSVFVDNSLFGRFHLREKYLSIPILYKFHSSILNFSLGPTFDIFVDWSRINKGLLFRRDAHRVDNKFHVGLMGKISKTIDLTKRIFIEPEIRYNRVFFQHRSFYGVGLSLKYTLAK